MHSRATATLSRTLGGFRAPILTFLVWVGFVVPGSVVLLDAPHPPADVTALGVAEAGGNGAILPAAGGSSLLLLQRDTVTRRGPANRFTGRADRDQHPGSDGGAARSSGLSSTPGRSRSASSATEGALASWHLSALARSGRLSAPTTAPPAARS